MDLRMPDVYTSGIDDARGASDVDDRRPGYVPLGPPLAAVLILMAAYGCAVNKAANEPFIGSGPVILTQEEKREYRRRHNGKTAGEEIAEEERKSENAKTMSGLLDNALKIMLLGL